MVKVLRPPPPQLRSKGTNFLLAIRYGWQNTFGSEDSRGPASAKSGRAQCFETASSAAGVLVNTTLLGAADPGGVRAVFTAGRVWSNTFRGLVAY